MSNENLPAVKENEIAKWNNEKWAEVKKMFIPAGVSDKDAQIFLELAKSYQLNPFRREIWVLPFKNHKTGETTSQVFAGRDGYLTIAHRTGQYGGMSTDFGFNKQNGLVWAETTAWNKSCEHPTKAKVFLKEYSTGRNLWASKPATMLQKVSESHALRRAFNINGLYSPEEFDQTLSNEEPPTNGESKMQIEPPKEKETVQKGDFNKALKLIEDCRSPETLDKIAGVMNERTWSDDHLKFLLDKIEAKNTELGGE